MASPTPRYATTAMVVELEAAVRSAVADPDTFGIVITGAGRGFCAGLDASALQATASGHTARNSVAANRLPGLFSMLLEQPKPIVAAVNGVAAGGGFVLAAKCDLRFAAEAVSVADTKRLISARYGVTMAPAFTEADEATWAAVQRHDSAEGVAA